MKLYRLTYTVRPPESDEEPDKFIAEIAALPGCRAWGDSPAEAIENLQSVAAAFIESYHNHGSPLPDEVVASVVESAAVGSGEVFVAV